MSRFIPNEPDRVEQTGVVFKEIFYEPGEMQRAASWGSFFEFS